MDVADLVQPTGTGTGTGARRDRWSGPLTDAARAPSGWGRRALGSPLAHFAVLGALLYGSGQAISPARPPPAEPIVIPAEAEDRLRAEWLRSTGREPTAIELERQVADLVDDELLFRAALALGLQHEDAVVARRLIANRRFVETEDERQGGRSDALLLRDAHALELAKTDLVVRRRLVERMRGRIVTAARSRVGARSQGPRDAPSTDARARIRFHHVFLSRDARGERLADDAAALFERVSTEALSKDDATRLGLGDPLLLPGHQPWSSKRELEAQFGAEFAARAFQLPTERWSAPIPSSYGLHLVFVEDRVEPEARMTDEDERARQGDDRADRDRAALREALSLLRRDVEVIREGLQEEEENRGHSSGNRPAMAWSEPRAKDTLDRPRAMRAAANASPE